MLDHRSPFPVTKLSIDFLRKQKHVTEKVMLRNHPKFSYKIVYQGCQMVLCRLVEDDPDAPVLVPFVLVDGLEVEVVLARTL
jgi:hypothetical protein